MSSTGNRSNPNQTRLAGHSDDGPENPNRSDITDKTQADSKSPGGRSSMKGSDSHQETREHNKHNHQGQSGHKPQKHSPAEEKH